MEEVLAALGPCGINCSKCFAYSKGEIKQNSLRLNENLGNFEVYAERFVKLLNEPTFNRYPDFKEVLDLLCSVNCNGCREEKCMIFSDCNVRDCSKEKGVDFCFICEEFPCDKTGFDEHLHKRWIAIQEEMKKIGPEKYYENIKDKPRY